MDVLKYLNEIEQIVEEASAVPFSGKVMVDQLHILDLIKEIRLDLPDQVKEASYINEKKDGIIEEAKREADQIVQEARIRRENLIEESEIVRESKDKSHELILSAQHDANEIRMGALEYADSLLSKTESNIEEMLHTLRLNRSELGVKEDR